MHAALIIAQLVLGSVRVIDGDTLHDNERQHTYRLAGIDAPEILRARCPAERAAGEAAAARVRELVASALHITARAAWDPAGRKRWPTDGFGRRIAIIEIDGQDLAQILIAEHLAATGPLDWCDKPSTP